MNKSQKELLKHVSSRELINCYNDFVNYTEQFFENTEDFWNEEFTSKEEAEECRLSPNYNPEDNYVRFDCCDNSGFCSYKTEDVVKIIERDKNFINWFIEGLIEEEEYEIK